MDNFQTFITVFCAVIVTASALECYSCRDNDSNRKDCIHNRKSCSQFQDACTTYIRWGVPSEWTARGDRIYFISKDCDTQTGCRRRQAATQTACNRDWYNDWACVDCCTGDLCNYYVTLGAGSVRANTLLAVALAFVICIWRIL